MPDEWDKDWGEPQIDPYVLMERRWRHSRRRPTKHDPVFSQEEIIGAAFAGNSASLEMVASNRRFPTRRHWRHHVHSEFGLPCDDECKPRTTYSGTSLIERIKAAVNLDDFADRFTELRGQRNRTGKCFLHGETHGQSFSIYENYDGERKWKCFGACGIGGDVLDLIQACDERGIEWRPQKT